MQTPYCGLHDSAPPAFQPHLVLPPHLLLSKHDDLFQSSEHTKVIPTQELMNTVTTVLNTLIFAPGMTNSIAFFNLQFKSYLLRPTLLYLTPLVILCHSTVFVAFLAFALLCD